MIDYKIYNKGNLYIFAYIFGLILMAAVKFIGTSSGGAKRWIYLGFTSFQPSELMKIILIIFYAALLTRLKEKNKLKNIFKGFFFPILFILPVVAILYFWQNHVSAILICVFLMAILMFMAGTRIIHWIMVGVPTAIAAAIFLFTSSGFRGERIQTWLNPWAYKSDEGWQIIQSLYAIGSGGLFGVGLRK